MNVPDIIAAIRHTLRCYPDDPITLRPSTVLTLIEECEQQRTRAEAAEAELRELRQSLRDNAIEEGFRS